MKYDIEADWILLQTCNYRCDYCFSPPEILAEKLRIHATPREWQAAYDATGRTWLLHITGGEPSIYPDFVELCERLTERHYISLNSNLAHPSIASFARAIDPSRVSFINAALHLEERERRSGHGRFIANAEVLLERGFPLLVSLVATPAALARFDDAVDALRPLGLVPIPKLFRGVYAGKTYPAAYSAAELERFTRHADVARRCYAPALARMGGPPTLDIFRDDEFLAGEPTFTGELCDAGYRFVRIEPDGGVRRCSSPAMGNLLAGTFVPRQGATACDTQFCYYFCEKYTATARATAAQANAPRLSLFRSALEALRVP